MKKLIMLLSLFALATPAMADWIRPIKPNPVTCTGSRVDNPNAPIRLSIKPNQMQNGLEIAYVDESGWYSWVLGSPVMTLEAQGNLYIQQKTAGYSLFLESPTLEKLAGGDYASTYTLTGVLQINNNARYNLNCTGHFDNVNP